MSLLGGLSNTCYSRCYRQEEDGDSKRFMQDCDRAFVPVTFSFVALQEGEVEKSENYLRDNE